MGEILSPHCSCPCQAKPLLLLIGRRVGRGCAVAMVLGVPGNSGAAREPKFDCLMHYCNRAPKGFRLAAWPEHRASQADSLIAARRPGSWLPDHPLLHHDVLAVLGVAGRGGFRDGGYGHRRGAGVLRSARGRQ